MLVKKMAVAVFAALYLVAAPQMLQAQGTLRSVNDDLMYRISFGRAQDVQMLLEKGAETNIYGGMGDTPIILAISRNTVDAVNIIKALLAKGADPNFPDKVGHYPLEMAVKSNKAEVVEVLINGGADMRMKTLDGTAVVDLANKIGNPDVMKVINDALGKEMERDASMRDPARLLTLIHQLTTSVCELTYWNNYLVSEQNPKDNESTRSKIEKNKTLGEKSAADIALYFPKVEVSSFVQYAGVSINNVFQVLNTNELRTQNGIGSDKDAHDRCKPIADASRETIAASMEQQKKAEAEAARRAELMR